MTPLERIAAIATSTPCLLALTLAAIALLLLL